MLIQSIHYNYTENAKWPKGAVHVKDSHHSLVETMISANGANATTATSHHQLHGGMNRLVHMHVLSLQIPSDLLICRLCRDDVTRVLANPCHVPRWRRVRGKTSNCRILGCSSVSTYQVQHAFESAGLNCSSEVIPVPTPLCKYHYHTVYNALQPRECTTCGTRLRGNSHRPCPKPDVIQVTSERENRV